MFTTIEIDFDVYKEITVRRETPEMTENDVLRKLFNLSLIKTSEKKSNEKSKDIGVAWVWKGVILPHGTELRAEYDGRIHNAEISNGKIIYNGESHKTPSAAARDVTKTSINGWTFWECKIPGKSEWILIDKLRKT